MATTCFATTPISAISAAAAAESILQRPSYSINGILGIPPPAQVQQQPDANANNINKRKRDDEDDHRDLDIHADDEIKRARSGSYQAEVYANMGSWGTGSPGSDGTQQQQQQQQQPGAKWPQVKEEPKGLNVQLPELLNPSGPPLGPAPGSPHHPAFQYSAPPPVSGVGGFGPANPGGPPPSGTPEHIVPFTSSNTSTSVSSDLIYDSINMSSQVQNYSPSLSSSLGRWCINCRGLSLSSSLLSCFVYLTCTVYSLLSRCVHVCAVVCDPVLFSTL